MKLSTLFACSFSVCGFASLTPLQVSATTPAAASSPTVPMSCLIDAQKLSNGQWAIKPSQLKWTKGFFGGSPHAAILGDETKPSLYVYRTLVPKGQLTPVHYHPDFRFVTVLTGNLLVGFTDKFDEKSMVLLPPGGAWIEPVRHAHYIYAKQSDVVVQVMGCGPTKMIPIEPSQQPIGL